MSNLKWSVPCNMRDLFPKLSTVNEMFWLMLISESFEGEKPLGVNRFPINWLFFRVCCCPLSSGQNNFVGGSVGKKGPSFFSVVRVLIARPLGWQKEFDCGKNGWLEWLRDWSRRGIRAAGNESQTTNGLSGRNSAESCAFVKPKKTPIWGAELFLGRKLGLGNVKRSGVRNWDKRVVKNALEREDSKPRGYRTGLVGAWWRK